ncbi:MAG: formate--tetrahydrofolate ligase [Planctomycetales bacterium]
MWRSCAQFGLPAVVAINHFPTDSDKELELLRKIALDRGATAVAISDAFSKGGAGAEDLARAVESACQKPAHFKPLYELDASPEEKIEILATKIYGASGVDYDLQAKRKLTRIHELGLNHLPICMAKTQYSLSHDPKLLGRPHGFKFQIRDIRVSAGAGFLYPLAGEMNTMPGLSSEPAAMKIDVDPTGEIHGLR